MTLHSRCWAEIDLQALRENLVWLRHGVGSRVKILTVVKADAYGHGLKQIASVLMQSGTDMFGVANLSEAAAIRSVGKGWPILMLGACLRDDVQSMIHDEVRPTISSFAEAKPLSAAAKRAGKVVPVHIKVDTGMGRLGIQPGKALRFIQQVRTLANLRLEGVCTHYSSAEDDTDFSQQQARRFCSVLEELSRAGIAVPLIHANNSAAILHEPKTMFDLVRPGLLVYGVMPVGKRLANSSLQKSLRPALSFKCRVSFVKQISAGMPVSYGRTFLAPRKMRVATLTAGYGDGYLRSGSNRAEVLIGGRRCAIIGRITMDQMMVDVSGAKGVRGGEEAVLIGRQGCDQITVAEVAAWCGTIPCEVLTNISHRVPRVYCGGHAA